MNTDPNANHNTLPVTRAADLRQVSQTPQWLVENLWAQQAVGILGGEPKCCKTFLALDIAVAVASATPCLRHFPVRQTGPVLLYPAEDSVEIVRRRLDGIAQAAGVQLADLDIHVITASTLRLDSNRDRARLLNTVQHLQPTLLILDPFIRLHAIDENVSSEVAPILAYLRELQRRFCMAIILVHHAKKGAGKLRPGQALRGSSDLHGWGDSNLYLRRIERHLSLTAEHRGAPSHDDLRLHLADDDSGPSLAVLDKPPKQPPDNQARPSPQERIRLALVGQHTPLSFQTLRERCRMRTATFSETLNNMIGQGLIRHTDHGYRLPDAKADKLVSLSLFPMECDGNGNGKRPPRHS